MADPQETNDLSHDPAVATVKDDLLERMYERLTQTREGLLPIPAGLSRMGTIHWCLVPRDRGAERANAKPRVPARAGRSS